MKTLEKKYAIKVCDKTRIKDEERESMRSEVAILSILHHPNVLAMREVFETYDRLYIVTQLFEYGDLHTRMKNLKRPLSEAEAKLLIWRLIQGVMYLHSFGVVHRDIKPENLLMVNAEDNTNIVLSDFGLSKFVAPKEEMKMACGTISYVGKCCCEIPSHSPAPEVLRLTGYNKAADYWSVGVILYLVLSLQLPFHSLSAKETVRLTLNSDISFKETLWTSISSQAKSLIEGLLRKDPKLRIIEHEALNHPWFDDIREEMDKIHAALNPDQRLI